MYPDIYDGGIKKAILNNITNNTLNRRINNKYLFNFKCFDEKYKTEFLSVDNQIYIGDQYFDINYINDTHDVSDLISYDVKCEHVSYRLIEDKLDNYANTGTPSDILSDLLTGTDFTVGTIDYTDPITLISNEYKTILQLVLQLVGQLGGEIDFSGFSISILNTIGQDNGYIVTLKKNLKGISRVRDKRGVDYTTYTIDLVNIFKSDEFKNLGLENLETVDLGDVITVVDEKMNITTTQSVVEISKDVIDDRNIKLTLSNTLDVINDSIYQNNQDAIKRSDKIFGVTINQDVGIEIERTDKLAKVTFNANELSMKVGDGLGSYTDAVFFDVLNALFKFIGILEVTNTSNVKVKIDPDGANIFSITDGSTELFTVSSGGVATFKDTISTTKNAIVGNSIQLGQVLSGLHNLIFGPPGAGYNINASASTGLTITSAGVINLDGSSGVNINGSITTFGSSAVNFDTFTTVDGKTVTVRNGIITNIV